MLAFGAMRVMEPTPFGKYTLLKRENCGLYGIGYKARTTSESGVDSLVFLKLLCREAAEDPLLVQEFFEDARIAKGFTHANLIRALDFGQAGDTYFVATEWVDGRDVCRVMPRTRSSVPRWLPAPVAVGIAIEIAHALHATHQHRDEQGVQLGLVRREIYSGAVILSYAGDVKLGAMGWHREERPLKDVGVLRGKIMYFSPEMIRGLPLDGRSDVYVLGLLLFQMLCGEIANNGDHDGARMDQVLKGRLQSAKVLNPLLDPALVEILEKALRVAPADRYQSAEAFAQAMDAWLSSADSRDPSDARRALLAELYPEEAVATRRPTNPAPAVPSLVERIKRWTLPWRAR